MEAILLSGACRPLCPCPTPPSSRSLSHHHLSFAHALPSAENSLLKPSWYSKVWFKYRLRQEACSDPHSPPGITLPQEALLCTCCKPRGDH